MFSYHLTLLKITSLGIRLDHHEEVKFYAIIFLVFYSIQLFQNRSQFSCSVDIQYSLSYSPVFSPHAISNNSAAT